MAFIELLSEGEAAERLGLPREKYRTTPGWGAPPPRGLRRLAALIGAIRGGMDLRRYELRNGGAAKDSARVTARSPTARCWRSGSTTPTGYAPSSPTGRRLGSTRWTLR